MKFSVCSFEGIKYESMRYLSNKCLQYSSIAQSVEQTAVNRWVVGSSPTRGVLPDIFDKYVSIAQLDRATAF